MFKLLTRLFGGGFIGRIIALVVVCIIAALIIAMAAAIIIYPLFFLGLLIGTAVSAEAYRHMYSIAKKRSKISVSDDTKEIFTLTMHDFIDAFAWRSGDVDRLKEECRTKEKSATEAVLRIERGTQSLKDTWQSLVDKNTIKENILAPRKLMSTRIKKAAILTFKDPSFAKLSEELEEETIKFENFLA